LRKRRREREIARLFEFRLLNFRKKGKKILLFKKNEKERRKRSFQPLNWGQRRKERVSEFLYTAAGERRKRGDGGHVQIPSHQPGRKKRKREDRSTTPFFAKERGQKKKKKRRKNKAFAGALRPGEKKRKGEKKRGKVRRNHTLHIRRAKGEKKKKKVPLHF